MLPCRQTNMKGNRWFRVCESGDTGSLSQFTHPGGHIAPYVNIYINVFIAL